MANPEHHKQNYDELDQILTLLKSGLKNRPLNKAMDRFIQTNHPFVEGWILLETECHNTENAVIKACLIKHIDEIMDFVSEDMDPLFSRHIYMTLGKRFIQKAAELNNQLDPKKTLSCHISTLCRNDDFRTFLHQEMSWFKLPASHQETIFAVLSLCAIEHINAFNGHDPAIPKWYEMEQKFNKWMDSRPATKVLKQA